MLTPSFHFSILNSFVDVFNEQSRILCNILGETCDSFPEGKADIDVYPMITRCSLDIICGKQRPHSILVLDWDYNCIAI